MENNYTLGRGKVHFARFKPGTQVPDGFRYIGNTPEFSLTIENENLDHFSSDGGIREKDDSVPLETTRSGSLSTDQISPENVSIFFFGASSALTTAAVTALSETILGAKRGYGYVLGVTPSTPAGVRGVNATTFLAKVGSATLVNGVDYELNADRGVITFKETATGITANGTDTVVLTYDLKATTRDRVISGSTPVEGAMMYEANNPKGKNFDYYLPYIRVAPNGDYNLKGDEWQTIPLSLEILKPANGEAIYLDSRPVYTT